MKEVTDAVTGEVQHVRRRTWKEQLTDPAIRNQLIMVGLSAVSMFIFTHAELFFLSLVLQFAVTFLQQKNRFLEYQADVNKKMEILEAKGAIASRVEVTLSA